MSRPAVRFHLPPNGANGVGPAAASASGHVANGHSGMVSPVPAPGGPPAAVMDDGGAEGESGCVDRCWPLSLRGSGSNGGTSPFTSSSSPVGVKVKHKSRARRKTRPGEEPIKRFYFRIDKVECNFDMALDQCFLEFEVGGVRKDETIETGDTKTKMKKVKDAQGNETTQEVQEIVKQRRVQILKPRADSFFTRVKVNIKAKQSTVFHDTCFEGYWEGPYSDLKREYLTVKLWHLGGAFAPNQLIGQNSEKLQEVVASKMDREMRILKYVPGAIAYRKETMARLRYKFEFQEDYEYTIRFKDWELRRMHEPIYPEVEKKRWGYFVAGQRQLSFEILQSHQSWSSYLAAAAKAYLFPCAKQRWENECELAVEKEGTSGRAMGVIRYPGTRAWLEEESLRITLKKNVCCCIPVVIGRQTQELQGVLDYGHIDTTMDVIENVNARTFLPLLFGHPRKQTFKIDGTVDSSSLGRGDSLPLYRQLGNADPSQDSFSLLSRDAATYLVVKVIRAKGLSIPSRDEVRETLNPSVTIYWNRMQKSTRVAEKTNDPFWDDSVYFRIMDRDTARKEQPKKFEDFNEETKQSRIELVVWDNYGLCGRTPLGKCHVDFPDVYHGREPKKIISFSSNGRAVDRLVLSSGERQLEAPFADDGAERKKAQHNDEFGRGGSAGSGSGGQEFNTRFIEFLVYFDRLDSKAIPRANKRDRERDLQAARNHRHLGEPLTPERIKSGRAYWDAALKDVEERDKRFFPFYGIDEYSGTAHFLPSFLKPMQPPAEIRAIGTLLFFIFSIELIEMPRPSGDGPRDVWSYADPYFFLEKRKGDIRDHAMLLCNFLLGLSMDAYVCVGSARTRDGGRKPHFWVMTREKDVEAASGSPSYLVRFWECTNGRTYPIRGHVTDAPPDPKSKRYIDEADVRPPPIDEFEFKKMRQKQAEEERKRALGMEQVQEEGEEGEGEEGQEGHAEGEGEDDADADGNEGSDDDNEGSDDGDDVSTDGADLASPSGAAQRVEITAKMRATLSPKELLQLEIQNQQAELEAQSLDPDEEMSDMDLLSLTVGNAAPMPSQRPAGVDVALKAKAASASASGSALALDDRHAMDDARSVFDEQKLALVSNDRALARHRKSLVAALEDPTLKAQKKASGQQCPYASVDLVFNHKHLYANLGHADPELCFFDFERHPDRWAEFGDSAYRHYLGIHHLKEFYADKGVASVKAPQEDAERCERNITESLRDKIREQRKYHRTSMETEFIQQFDFQMDEQNDSPDNTAAAYIRRRLQHEHECALRPKHLQPLALKLDGDVQIDYDYVDREWRRRILNDLLPNEIYLEKCLFFKHCDLDRIPKEVVDECVHMVSMEEFRKPRFALGCHLVRMPASICPVRVFLCVIAKDE